MREPVYTRLNEYERGALAIAGQLWPEFDGDAERVRAIINDWRRGREEGGKSARIERLERKLNLVLSHLGVSFE